MKNLTTNKLKEILKDYTKDSLEYFVLQDLIRERKTPHELSAHVADILNYGCRSGMVSSLIYFSDTKKFFSKFQDDIFELYNETKEELGDLGVELSTNYLAWFGYETTLRNLAYNKFINYKNFENVL